MAHPERYHLSPTPWSQKEAGDRDRNPFFEKVFTEPITQFAFEQLCQVYRYTTPPFFDAGLEPEQRGKLIRTIAGYIGLIEEQHPGIVRWIAMTQPDNDISKVGYKLASFFYETGELYREACKR